MNADATTAGRIIPCVFPAELACLLPGQYNMQPAYIELDLREGTLLADYWPNVECRIAGAVTDGFERYYPIPALTAEAANVLMEELLPLTEQIVGGWEEEWDGCNRIVSLSPEAHAAQAKILERLGVSADGPECQVYEDGDLVGVWELDGVTNGYEVEEYGITAATTDERLREIEALILQGMEDCGAYRVNTCAALLPHLQGLRDELATDDDC